MSETWSFFVAALSTIFVIVEPLGVVLGAMSIQFIVEGGVSLLTSIKG